MRRLHTWGKLRKETGVVTWSICPPLLEDEENVSLADILSLRDSCLSEEEVWAVCAECVLALQSIRPSHLFHTLCITPDTLAFNAHGNVCFMEQLSDDPEGCFVPPEFDNTGSTFEGHVYSLGSTLSAALNFVIEPELEAELGEEIQKLLEQMQEEKPEHRPLLQDVLCLAEARLSHTSPAAVCRKLSSVGRRVLSIESVSTFQDGQEGSWEARWQHPKPRCLLKRTSSVDNAKDLCAGSSVKANGLSRQQVCGGWDFSLWAEDMDSCEGDCMILADDLDCRSHNSSPVRRRAQQRPNRSRGALNRSCSVPDSNNPPCLSPPTHGDISIPVSDLTEIGADEHLGCTSMWSSSFQRLDRGRSCESYPHSSTEDCGNQMSRGYEDAAETLCSGETQIQGCHECESKDGTQDSASSCASCQELEMEQDPSEHQSSLNHSLYIPNNYMTKSMLCLNEESQDEWISLRELLTRCGRRLTVNELWALCYTCLSSLQTYIDFPAYLCLDTLHVGCEGEVLFLKPKNMGSRDAFYLAPEYQEHGIVTEKVCVYGVAAILWAATKFSLSPHQKLAMPRKLKRLLLEMAKRTPIERPTIVMAKKSCRDYLSCRGTNAEAVWNNLISRVHPPASKSSNADDLSATDTQQSSCDEESARNSGFVPLATESRLAPVTGPVPHSYPVSKELRLPEAFTSTATHFTPIILTNEGDSEEESQDRGAAIEGTKSSQHMEERGLDFPPHGHSDYPCPAQTKPDLHTQELPVHQTVITTTSGYKLPVNSASTLPDISCLEVSLPPPLSADLGGRGVFNNYLFRQDPTTGRLSLVPVQVRAPESLLGLDINLSLVPQPLQGLITGPESADGPFINCLNAPVRPGPRECGPPASYFNGSSIISDSPLERGVPRACNGQTNPGTQAENQPPSESISPNVHPALREVIELLSGEFSLHGHLDNGHEDIAMGECIFSLKDFQYHTFASVVKERFSDLYWEDDLLGVLHCLVNYSPSSPGSNEQPPSKAVKRAALTPPLAATAWGGEREVRLRGHLDLNGNVHAPSPAAVGCWIEGTEGTEGTEALPCQGGEEAALEDFDLRSEESQPCIFQGMSTDSSEAMAMEGGEHGSAGGSDESPSEEFPSGREEGRTGARDQQMSPDCSEDMEDSDSLVSELLVSPGSRAEGPGLSSGPAWALAFFGEECFGPEVIQYAVTLGQHMGAPCLDVKTLELQQQLLIETKNLKKTRNFFQKLIQQERKNKGDNKLMLSKLKSQLEELRSKVVFLDCVKKYLEVLTKYYRSQHYSFSFTSTTTWLSYPLMSFLAFLQILSVDQWGLEVSLLPALAVCGPGSLDFQSSEDSSVLSFGTSKGKSTLQAGSPLGLMAHLYARNAAVEGFIQQFLYTYRFLCTPEELLQFIMDKFICAARQGPDMSGDCVKILHRSLDLLQFWITDCKQVDFTPKSSLVDTLENFLNAEVIPVDSRGEALLAALHSLPCTTWIQGRGSLVSFEEDDDSMCVHSSNEDLVRKWRFSRVVESSASLPKDRAFSIAAALPVPCYGSPVDDLPAVCLQSEERLPFGWNENGAQHVTQQLTLLQQGMFQGCHPVHFLNSRIQGVGDKVWTPNKNVSQHLPPAEGSSPLECEETPSDSYLQQLLTYADSVANWISAEIVICDSVKTQVALLTKYLWIGKHCYESRNFATAMQVLGGLENGIVRQLPAWKHLSSKVCEILEELRAVQVFLKSDDLCLMGGEHTRRRPTLPSAHILAMHVQQLEIGAFTLTTGAYKWTKLRSIAKVVSQVHAFQEAVYPYSPDRELQDYLRRRIARLAPSDIHLLAADKDASFQQTSERQARRIQDKLRRVKATFQ
ncbi:kinase non-catalytic C-lobe domain-containing protein 1 isoform X3 [Anarrhichthys ocellatus]|uniref:kinase non-catalytic C-lobe domain-containing protein 1 isoform X3 n=1 Tax=Anarrhichthys ocellatus TaxID=433405 RepID=UPI0012ED46CC|nr:kinase non-catalytic C-lobe domain-containing protein 1 isoform X3 [Anarrhichthys ocellatus]